MLKRKEREQMVVAATMDDESGEVYDQMVDSDISSSSDDEQDAVFDGDDENNQTKNDDDDANEAVESADGTRIKVLLLGCRGVNARQRHLMDDICALSPQIRKESKFDGKKALPMLNELAELNDASHVVLFEPRKPHELFLWIAKTPSGPSMRFNVQNIHTLDEMNLPGNCMRGARPILTFDHSLLDLGEHGQVMKDLLTAAFAAPEHHRKTRPYIDRVMHFGWRDGRIWVRNYQLMTASDAVTAARDTPMVEAVENMNLVEIGPRFVLQPVRLLEGSFRGRTLWLNEEYVSPSQVRATKRLEEVVRHRKRVADQEASELRRSQLTLPRDDLDTVFE